VKNNVEMPLYLNWKTKPHFPSDMPPCTKLENKTFFFIMKKPTVAIKDLKRLFLSRKGNYLIKVHYLHLMEHFTVKTYLILLIRGPMAISWSQV
jgi:hypothetical protein